MTAEDREEQFKPFGYFLVTWLLLIYANSSCASSSAPRSSSVSTQPTGWMSGIPSFGDEENDG
jgi:hypothetical protein